MIYVIVGPSHAGKTSFTSNSFIKGECKLYKDITWVTECDTSYLLGNYISDKRARGSDMIARQEVKLIKDQVIKLATDNSGKDVVLEGDKVCSRKIMDAILEQNLPCKIYYIRCSLETSINRNKKFSSTVAEKILKTVATKAKNLYVEYCDRCDGEYVNTDDITDFTKFSKDSKDVKFIKGSSDRRLF